MLKLSLTHNDNHYELPIKNTSYAKVASATKFIIEHIMCLELDGLTAINIHEHKEHVAVYVAFYYIENEVSLSKSLQYVIHYDNNHFQQESLSHQNN